MRNNWTMLWRSPTYMLWFGYSDDWADYLPCDPEAMAGRRLWYQLHPEARGPESMSDGLTDR
jgi:hypothetical protein